MVAVNAGAIAERRVIMRLMRANAMSVEHSQPLDDLNWMQARRLQRLLNAGVVRQSQPGRYYLDAPSLADRLTSRRQRLAVLLFIVLAAMGAITYFGSAGYFAR